MSEIYTGTEDDRRYTGEQVDISYSLKRCLHAEECVRGLPQVFDTAKRPWINASGADAEAITEVVMRCPSGALHVARKDGGQGEQTPPHNTVVLRTNDFLQITGDLSIRAAGVEIEGETRAALCRCGASQRKPFCDNSHQKIGFQAPEPAPFEFDEQDEVSSGGKLVITAYPNGSYEFDGNFEIRSQSGKLLWRGSHAWFCRCGGSANKPFCDATHKRNGFTAA